MKQDVKTVELNRVSFRYPRSDQEVIRDFSMEIRPGEIVGILGPSGCGKSTLLRIIAGLEQNQKGDVILGGIPVAGENLWVPPEQRQVGMVFQDYALFPHLNVEKNVMYGLRELSRTQRKKRAEEVLRLVELWEFRKSYPAQLSGGQQQRVALARSLAPRPRLLLMDEPFSNLDTMLRKRIREEILEILRSENITCVFVTHDPEDAGYLAGRMLEIGQAGPACCLT